MNHFSIMLLEWLYLNKLLSFNIPFGTVHIFSCFVSAFFLMTHIKISLSVSFIPSSIYFSLWLPPVSLLYFLFPILCIIVFASFLLCSFSMSPPFSMLSFLFVHFLFVCVSLFSFCIFSFMFISFLRFHMSFLFVYLFSFFFILAFLLYF